MKFHPVLSKLTATFFLTSYKIHSLHTDVSGPIFLGVHELLGDIYSYLEDQVDWVKERSLILGYTTPFRVSDLQKLCKIPELDGIPDMGVAISTTIKDLQYIESELSEAIDATSDDLVTQNQLLTYADAIGKFRRKLSMITS